MVEEQKREPGHEPDWPLRKREGGGMIIAMVYYGSKDCQDLCLVALQQSVRGFPCLIYIVGQVKQ